MDGSLLLLQIEKLPNVNNYSIAKEKNVGLFQSELLIGDNFFV
jgi:hypothetical protein